jgi:hypothetical protein
MKGPPKKAGNAAAEMASKPLPAAEPKFPIQIGRSKEWTGNVHQKNWGQVEEEAVWVEDSTAVDPTAITWDAVEEWEEEEEKKMNEKVAVADRWQKQFETALEGEDQELVWTYLNFVTQSRKVEIIQFCDAWGLNRASHKRLVTLDNRVLKYVIRKFALPNEELGKNAMLIGYANSVLNNQLKRDREVQGDAAVAAITLRENEIWGRYQVWGDSIGWQVQTDVAAAEWMPPGQGVAGKGGGAASSSWQGKKGWPRKGKVPSPPVKAGFGMHKQWIPPKRERSRTPRGRKN